MPRSATGHGITDPVQIRALILITPQQFGILIGQSESSVRKWIAQGLIQPYTLLPSSSTLILQSEVTHFLEKLEQAHETERARMRRFRVPKATA